MIRRTALSAGVISLMLAAALVPAIAHEGHTRSESNPFDPDAPKRVSPETALAIGLKTAEVDFGRVEDVMRLTGAVRARPDRLRAVAPRTSGIVRSVAVQPGDIVRKGDPIAEIESQDLVRSVYELRRLEAEYERLLADGTRAESLVRSLEIELPAAIAAAEITEAEVARLSAGGEGVSANLIAQRQADAVKLRADAGLKAVALDQARADVLSLRTQAASTLRSVEALRALVPASQSHDAAELLADPARPGLVRFLAPIDGVVIARSALVGQGVEAGAKVLTIGDFTSVQIDGEAPESLVDTLSGAGTPEVRIRRPGDAALITTGRVRFISPVIEPGARTAHVIIDADNPGARLRQGMLVELSVVLRQTESAVVAPVSAIVQEGPLRYVFVKENEFYRKQDVATGARDDRVVEIKQGLAPGDVIVVSGAFSLSQLRGATSGPAVESGHDHTHD